MKALHGFSPLSAAAFLVAALVLPVVLFPFGAALLMNIVFAYGYREYQAKSSADVYWIFIKISTLASVIFLSIFGLVPFYWTYSVVKFISIFGIFLRNDLPDGFELTIFTIYFHVAILTFCPLILYNFKNTTVSMFQPYPRNAVSGYRMQALYSMLPFCFFVIAVLQLAYLNGYLSQSIDAREADNILQKRSSRESIEVLLCVFIILSCYIKMFRQYFYSELNRKY